MFDVKYPIIQAPMAGGATTVELITAVCNSGGLGSLGAGYMSVPKIRETIKNIKRMTNNPFLVNLFIPEFHTVSAEQMDAACSCINKCTAELNVMTRPVMAPYSESFKQQVEVLLDEKIPIFSFTFGVLSGEIIYKFKKNNTYLIGTATTLAEAQALQDSGIDAVVVQGCEAGAHRGTFLQTAEDSLVPLERLLGQVKRKINLPIIASGGIMNGKHIANMLQGGAAAVQMGTAFLTCHEAGIHSEYKKALLNKQQDDTVFTKAFSGKLARGIRNNFIDAMSDKDEYILEYPIQNKLTVGMRNAAKAQNNINYMSMWAGEAFKLSRNCNANELINDLVRELSVANKK